MALLSLEEETLSCITSLTIRAARAGCAIPVKMSCQGLEQERTCISYLRTYDTRGSWRASLALETLMEERKRERDDTCAKESSSEGPRQPPDCSSSGETTDQEQMDTQRKKKPEIKEKVEKCVFVHLYRDETEEENEILKAQLCSFDGVTMAWLKDWPYIYMYNFSTLLTPTEENGY